MNNEIINTNTAAEVAKEIIRQLGGSKFIAMTGSKNFFYSEISEYESNICLRMDLAKNISGTNKLKISLMPNDTYTMKFMNIKMNPKTFVVFNTKEQIFEGVYADQLKTIFSKVTGMDTNI